MNRILPVLIFCVSTATASAQQVEWLVTDGGNGHLYEAVAVSGGITWEDARLDAVERGGDLVSITSAEENAFIFDLIAENESLWFNDYYPNGIGPWIGLYQKPESSEPAGGWRWVSGEPFEFANWYAGSKDGEPNNFGGDEERGNFFGYRTPWANTWNDIAADERLRGYIIEFIPAEPETPDGTDSSDVSGVAGASGDGDASNGNTDSDVSGAESDFCGIATPISGIATPMVLGLWGRKARRRWRRD